MENKKEYIKNLASFNTFKETQRGDNQKLHLSVHTALLTKLRSHSKGK